VEGVDGEDERADEGRGPAEQARPEPEDQDADGCVQEDVPQQERERAGPGGPEMKEEGEDRQGAVEGDVGDGGPPVVVAGEPDQPLLRVDGVIGSDIEGGVSVCGVVLDEDASSGRRLSRDGNEWMRDRDRSAQLDRAADAKDTDPWPWRLGAFSEGSRTGVLEAADEIDLSSPPSF